MPDPLAQPQIVERDGNVVRIVAGDVEVIAEMFRSEDEILFDRLSIDGLGPGTVGTARLRQLARTFAKSQGVRQLRVRGTTRTTGANPGKSPREVVIRV
jgi:hypothetical protein